MNTFNTLLMMAGLCPAFHLAAQTVHGVIGADAQMQAAISTTIGNSFAAFNNPSQMSRLSSWQTGLYSEQRFLARELSLSSLSVVIPNRIADAGAGISYYGFGEFNQQRFVFSVSKKLAQTLSLGVQFNYVMTNISGYGSAGTFVPGAGVTYLPTDRLVLGFTIYNPGQRTLSDRLDDKLPSYARLGIQYKVNANVFVLTEAEQQTEQHIRLKGAVRYELHKRAALAVGASSGPVQFSFGTSLKASKVMFDMAANIHQVLGVTPQVSIRFPATAHN